MLKLSKSII